MDCCFEAALAVAAATTQASEDSERERESICNFEQTNALLMANMDASFSLSLAVSLVATLLR